MNTKLLGTDRPVAVYYSFLTDVDSISDQDVNSKVVSFKAGKDWNLINTTIGTIDFQENNSIENGSTSFSNDLTANCPGHEEKTPSDILNITGRKVLLRIDYKSGLKKLVGNKTNGPRITVKTLSTNSTVKKIQSNWKTNQPNYWLV